MGSLDTLCSPKIGRRRRYWSAVLSPFRGVILLMLKKCNCTTIHILFSINILKFPPSDIFQGVQICVNLSYQMNIENLSYNSNYTSAGWCGAVFYFHVGPQSVFFSL